MIKKLLLALVCGGLIMVTMTASGQSNGFEFEAIDHQSKIRLEDFYGRVVLVVNTASECGFTGQYEGLENLYQTYKDRGFVVIGIPSNDFGGQEPGTNDQIVSFCQLNYGVSFPMTTKLHVKGKEADPFYVWAKKKLGFGSGPKWNFHKYLISREGELIDYFNSTTKPDSNHLIKAIEQALQS